MTDIEKLDARINAVTAAIDSVKSAITVERKMSSDKHMNGHLTKAISELTVLLTGLNALKTRMETVGR